MINVQIKIHTKDKVNTKEKNYRRISKNISQKSKEKLTKDFIKIPKEKTYNANSWYFYQLFCVYYCNIKIFLWGEKLEFKHKPVMLEECIEGLKIKSDGIYVDGTLGGAGHSKEILKRLSKNGLLIGCGSG